MRWLFFIWLTYVAYIVVINVDLWSVGILLFMYFAPKIENKIRAKLKEGRTA